MGVPTLWPVLAPAATYDTLLGLSVEAWSKGGVRGIRLGCDASLWLFHARKMASESADEVGVNADLRVLLFRIFGLMRDGVLPLFVFDGPKKPKWKRGAHVGGSWGGSKHRDFQRLLDLLGIPWRIAAGEGEAELAAMAKRGELDGVLTDDVDTLLFGAPLVVRNTKYSPSSTSAAPSSSQRPPSSPVKGGPSSSQPSSSQSSPPHAESHKLFYADVIFATVGFEVEDLIFCALLSGGDYAPGMYSMGIKTAEGLSKGGYGKELLDGIAEHEGNSKGCAAFIKEWRASVVQELKTNSQGYLSTRKIKAAEELNQDTSFPDLAILKYYTHPAITVGAPPPDWSTEPDIPSLISFLSDAFEWGNAQVEQTCRNLLYPGLAMRELRKAALAADSSLPPSISPSLFEGVYELKTASSTKNIPSYRVQLSSDTFESLISAHLPSVDPFPIPLDPTQQVAGRRTKQIEDAKGTTPWRHWIPVEMVKEHPRAAKLARRYERSYEEKEREKEEKAQRVKSVAKSSKGKGLAGAFGVSKAGVTSSRTAKGKGKKKAQDSDEPVTSTDEDEPPLPSPRPLALPKPKTASRRRPKDDSAPSSSDELRAPPPPKSPRKSKAQVSASLARSQPPKTSKASLEYIEISDSDEEEDLPAPVKRPSDVATAKSATSAFSLSPPPPRARPSCPAEPSSSFKSTLLAFPSSKSTSISSGEKLKSTSQGPSTSKSRSILIESSEPEEELLLTSKEMMRQRSGTGSVSGSGSASSKRTGEAKEGKSRSAMAGAKGAPQRKCEELILVDSDDE